MQLYFCDIATLQVRREVHDALHEVNLPVLWQSGDSLHPERSERSGCSL